MLMNGVIPRAAPSKELLETIRLLRNIANNINQIAKQANTNGSIDVEMYKSNYIQLQKQIDEIMWMIREPTKMEENMAITKIWPVKDNLSRVYRYISNENETTEDISDGLNEVLTYTTQGYKTNEFE